MLTFRLCTSYVSLTTCAMFFNMMRLLCLIHFFPSPIVHRYSPQILQPFCDSLVDKCLFFFTHAAHGKCKNCSPTLVTDFVMFGLL